MLTRSSILKRDYFDATLQDLGQAKTWAGNVVITNLLEGYFHTTVFGTDLAGNTGQYRSEDYITDNNPDFRIKVDHTAPVIYGYNWHTWGYQHGGKNSGNGKNDVYIGMLNRGYVTRSQTITLTAKAEAGQRAQFFVNGSTLGYTDVTADNCTIPDTAEALDVETASPGATTQNKYTTDGLLVRTAHQCNTSIDYTFTDDGANAEGGEPKHGYLFEMRVLDKAGNESNKSKEMLVYHDTVAPKKPVIQKFGPDHVYAEVERYAETEFVMTAPDGTETARQLLRADKFGSTDVFKLIFNEQYGTYRVSVTSWDQAGNVSEVAVEEFERDSVGMGGTFYSYGNYDFSKIILDIYVSDWGAYYISNYHIPTPVITSAEILNGTTTIKGSSIKKNHPMHATINYSPYFFVKCIAAGNCSPTTWRTQVIDHPTEHVLTSINKTDGTQVIALWPEDSENYSLTATTLSENQEMRSKTTIYGAFTHNGLSFSYRGLNAHEIGQNTGISSKWSQPKKVIVISTNKLPYGLPFEGNYPVTQWAYNASYSHNGRPAIDFGTPMNTPIRATMDGTVEYITNISDCSTYTPAGFGCHVILKNADSGYVLYYAHLSINSYTLYTDSRVKSVKKNDIIGYTGASGWSSDSYGNPAPHLHYEITAGNSNDPYRNNVISEVDLYNFLGISP